MTLVVQDDNGGVAGANGYIDVAEFKAYHDDRGNDYGTPTDPDIEIAITQATDYVDQRFRYVGQKRVGRDQTTQWPRSNAWDRDRYYVNDVPDEVKEATAEYALRTVNGETLNPDPAEDESGATVQSKEETVGPITEKVSYVDGAQFSMPRYPAADQKLRVSGLIRSGNDVIRA